MHCIPAVKFGDLTERTQVSSNRLHHVKARRGRDFSNAESQRKPTANRCYLYMTKLDDLDFFNARNINMRIRFDFCYRARIVRRARTLPEISVVFRP
jgi:hypothetical protein